MEPLLMTTVTAIISSVIGAIIGAIVSKIKVVKQATNDAKKESEEIREMQRLNLMMTCRMAVYDSHFNVDEKVEAYTIYRDCGGNHQTKTYMDGVVGGDIDDYIEKHRKKN